MAAVIHHGGAGTVAAGLRAGKPTMVCPFFGDQFFWGQMVYQAKVGVLPVPVVQLTAEKLAAAFQELRSPALVATAERLAERLSREDGAKEGLKAFYRHLPVEDMVCDVSLFTSKPRLARKYCATCGLKLSAEADAVLHPTVSNNDAGEEADVTPPAEQQPAHDVHDVHDYSAMDWASMVGPQDAAEGLVQGLTSLTHEVLGSVAGVVTEPVVGAQKTGVRGAARGLASGLVNLIRRPIRGGFIFVDKVTAGVSNQLQLQPQAVHGVGVSSSSPPLAGLAASSSRSASTGIGGPQPPPDQVEEEKEAAAKAALRSEEVAELQAGHAQALRCKELFLRLSKGDDACCVPKEGVLGLLEELGDGDDVQEQHHQQQTKVLSRALLDRIDAVGAGQISFQQFCVFSKALQRGGLLHNESGGGGMMEEAGILPAAALGEIEVISRCPTGLARGALGEESEGIATSTANKSKLLDSLIFDTIFLEERGETTSVGSPPILSNPLSAAIAAGGGGFATAAHHEEEDDNSSTSSSSSDTMEDIEIQVELASALQNSSSSSSTATEG
jgi:hypothetical protein